MRKPLKIGKTYALAVSPDETRLVVVGPSVFVWDVQRGKKTFRCRPCPHPHHASFSPDGELIAVKDTSGRIVVIAAHDGSKVADFANDAEGEGSNLAFSACGKFLVDGSWSGWLRVRQSSDGKIVFAEEFPQELIDAIHHDGARQRWTLAHHPTIRPTEEEAPPAYFTAWDWPIRKRKYKVLPRRIGHLHASALSPDGTRLAVVHGTPAVSLDVFELPSTEPAARTPITFAGTTWAIRWSPDGRLLGSVQDKRIAIYHVPDLSCIAELALPFPSDVAFCPKSGLIVLGDWEQGLAVPFAC
jgi:WD40 repeat protein